MTTKEMISNLENEKKELATRIMALNNAIYFDEDVPSKDLLREQRQAMDNYFECLEARILDLQQDIDDEEPETRQPNFIDRMADSLNEHIDELLDMIRSKPEINSLEELEGREIINGNPPRCHECSLDGTGCKKLILAGNQHICVK